jgi:nicotinamide-nucleotide amidase
MQAEVIAIGDELVTGQRLDTNSRWLSAELAVLGIPVVFHTTAADTLEAGIEAFRIAVGRADVVVATGGLGPTADDLTRDVLAALADRPLVLSESALAAIEARFAGRALSGVEPAAGAVPGGQPRDCQPQRHRAGHRSGPRRRGPPEPRVRVAGRARRDEADVGGHRRPGPDGHAAGSVHDPPTAHQMLRRR